MNFLIVFAIIFIQDFVNSESGLLILNITKNSPKYEYDHYDLILSGSNISNEVKRAMAESRSNKFQYTFVDELKLRSFVQDFSTKRIKYGRTMFYLMPKNITQFEIYMKIVRKLYVQPRNDLYVDSRLLTFIVCPIDGEKLTRDLCLAPFAKYFLLNCEIYVIFQKQGEFNVKEIYSLKNKIYVNPIPPPCESKIFKYCPKYPGLAHRRRNLEQVKLVFAALNTTQSEHCITFSQPHNNVSAFEDNHSCNQVLWDYQRLLNFRVEAKAESQYIWQESGSKLGGMGKILQTGEADVIISATYLLHYRLKYLTVLLPVGNEPILAYFLQPQASSVHDIYNLPFSRRVWIAIFSIQFCIFLTTIIFALFGAIVHCDPHWWSSYNFFWIICLACQKGWYFTPGCVSAKILVFITVMFSLVAYTAYSGALISGLANEPVPVSNVPDLVEHHFKFVFDPNVYNPFFSSRASSDWLADILKVNRIKEKFVDDSRAVQNVIEGQVAFLTTTRNFISAYYTFHQNDSYMCETVYKISLSKRFLQSAFFLPKGSPLKELLNSRLTILLENGLKHRYWTYYYQRNNSVECSEKKFSYRADLGVDDVGSAFIILMAGFLIAIVALLIERKIISVLKYLEFQRNYSFLSKEPIF